MSTNNDNTQVLEPVAQEEPVAVEAPAEAVPPVTKTKKELKKERKEIKKHKKTVKKEAKEHSAKATKAQKFFLSVLTLIVIASMLVCSYSAIMVTLNFTKVPTASNSNDAAQDSQNNADSNTNSNTSSAPSTNNTPTQDSSNNSTAEDTSSPSGDATTPDDAPAANGEINSKEAAVAYYKTAHAKVLAEAKSVTRTYDKPSNYNGVVEVGGNSTIAGIAQTLMNTFMTENTEPVVHEGSAIAENFPPANTNGTTGLTADMISEYTCEEKDGNYIITLTLNSTEENPDDGTMAGNLVDIVEVKQITDAAGDFVSLDGFENLYIGSTVTATIEKESGKMIALDVNNPSYMCFGKATALGFITVENCKLGLLYEQKWTIEW